MIYSVFYEEYSFEFDRAEQKLCLMDSLYAELVKNGTLTTSIKSRFYLRYYGISIRDRDNRLIYEFINEYALTYFLKRFN